MTHTLPLTIRRHMDGWSQELHFCVMMSHLTRHLTKFETIARGFRVFPTPINRPRERPLAFLRSSAHPCKVPTSWRNPHWSCIRLATVWCIPPHLVTQRTPRVPCQTATPLLFNRLLSQRAHLGAFHFRVSTHRPPRTRTTFWSASHQR